MYFILAPLKFFFVLIWTWYPAAPEIFFQVSVNFFLPAFTLNDFTFETDGFITGFSTFHLLLLAENVLPFEPVTVAFRNDAFPVAPIVIFFQSVSVPHIGWF